MTIQERIRNILILEDMKKNPKEAKKLGLVIPEDKCGYSKKSNDNKEMNC